VKRKASGHFAGRYTIGICDVSPGNDSIGDARILDAVRANNDDRIFVVSAHVDRNTFYRCRAKHDENHGSGYAKTPNLRVGILMAGGNQQA
jgi:hypothetical protein